MEKEIKRREKNNRFHPAKPNEWRPEHLKRWTSEDPVCSGANNYGGPDHSEYYVIALQCRDSKRLERSNFECIEKALDPEGEKETVLNIRTGHWAFGWFEWIMVHESDIETLKIAEEIVCALADYPVVNEEHYSELEWNETCEYWEQLSLSEKVDLCREHGSSIFSARVDSPYELENDSLLEYLQCE